MDAIVVSSLSQSTTHASDVKGIIVIASNRKQNSPADPKRDQPARMRSNVSL